MFKKRVVYQPFQNFLKKLGWLEIRLVCPIGSVVIYVIFDLRVVLMSTKIQKCLKKVV